MKMVIKLQWVAVLAVGFLFPNINFANSYEEFEKNLADTAKIDGILGSYFTKQGAQDTKNGPAELKKLLKEIDQKNKTDKEESANNAKIRENQDKIDLTKGMVNLLEINRQNKAKEVLDMEAKAKAALENLPTAAGSAKAPDISSLNGSCRDGVDFSQATSFAKQLETSPFNWLRDQSAEYFANRDEEAKAQKAKDMMMLAKTLDEAEDKGYDNDEDNQVKLQDAYGMAKAGKFAREARLKNQKEILAKQKMDLKESSKGFWKFLFFDLLPSMAKLNNPNDGQLKKLATMARDHAEQLRQTAQDQFVASADNLYQNCETIVQSLTQSNGNALSQGRLNDAYQMVSMVSPNYANTTFIQGLNQVAKNLRCTPAQDQIQDLYGGNLQAAIQSLGQAKDSKTLLMGLPRVIDAIKAANSQAEGILNPLIKDCAYAAKQQQKVDRLIGQAQQQMQSQQQQLSQMEQQGLVPPGTSQQAGVASTARRPGTGRSATTGAPTHMGTQVPGAANLGGV